MWCDDSATSLQFSTRSFVVVVVVTMKVHKYVCINELSVSTCADDLKQKGMGKPSLVF